MTQEEIIELAKQAGMMSDVLQLGRNLELLTDFAKLVAEKEREACAKMCEEYAIGLERNYSEIISDKIRARGQAC